MEGNPRITGFYIKPIDVKTSHPFRVPGSRHDGRSTWSAAWAKTENIETILQKLETLKLAEPTIKGSQTQWRTPNEKFSVPEAKGSASLMKFHEKSLLDAIQAFHEPKELRRYESLLLPMSPEDLALFYKNLDEFVGEQFNRFAVSEYKGRRVFQINLNIHPVTRPAEEPLIQTNDLA